MTVKRKLPCISITTNEQIATVLAVAMVETSETAADAEKNHVIAAAPLFSSSSMAVADDTIIINTATEKRGKTQLISREICCQSIGLNHFYTFKCFPKTNILI